MNTQRWHSRLMTPWKGILCLSGSVIRSLHSAILVFLLVYAHIFYDLFIEINKWLLLHFSAFSPSHADLLAVCTVAGQGEHAHCTLTCMVSWGCPSRPTLLAELCWAADHLLLCWPWTPLPGAGTSDSMQGLAGTQSKAQPATWPLQEMPALGNRRGVGPYWLNLMSKPSNLLVWE